MTDRGIESYEYNWTDHSRLPALKPLDILSHVGGTPILALAGRGRSEVKDYDLLVKWVKKVHGYFEDIAVPQMRPQDREVYNKIMESVRPLAARFDAATRNKLIPALADGQAALVIDDKLKSQQFCRDMPKLDKAMPMIELALVVRREQAGVAPRGDGRISRDLERRGRDRPEAQSRREELAKLKIPEPQSTKGSDGTVYFFPLPSEWGIDKQIAVSLGLSDKVATIAASNQHTDRLLAAKPLAVGGVLADPNRPLAAAAAFDWAGLIDGLTPWVEMGVDALVKAQPDVAKALGSESGKPSVMDQAHTVLGVLKVLRTCTGRDVHRGRAVGQPRPGRDPRHPVTVPQPLAARQSRLRLSTSTFPPTPRRTSRTPRRRTTRTAPPPACRVP